MTLTPGLQADLRQFGRINTKTADNAVMTSPLIAEWKGTQTPVMTLFGRRGQIVGFDLFDNTGGNFNFAVAALSGSGKSVFVNEMTYRYLGAGAKVWIIDVGRSYEKACRNFGGSFIEFTENAALSLNPFTFVQDIDEDMELLQPLLAQMVSPREPLDGFQYSTLGAAIKKTWKAKGNTMRVSDVHDLLATGRLDEARLSRAVDRVTGGMASWNGGRLIVPRRGMGEADFSQLMEGLTNADVGAAQAADGSPVTADMIRRVGRLRSIGEGRYGVTIGGFEVLTPDNRAYVLDLRSVPLRERAPPEMRPPGAQRPDARGTLPEPAATPLTRAEMDAEMARVSVQERIRLMGMPAADRDAELLRLRRQREQGMR